MKLNLKIYNKLLEQIKISNLLKAVLFHPNQLIQTQNIKLKTGKNKMGTLLNNI
jgi:hypothetical protein